MTGEFARLNLDSDRVTHGTRPCFSFVRAWSHDCYKYVLMMNGSGSAFEVDLFTRSV